jgi:NADH-quinone oxidoreductase subunit G
VDICPVGALTSTDFRFKMRVWFLKETKTVDVNDALGCNIIVGSRENVIYRITPRENNDVNGVWLPDSHRLNFKYVNAPERLKTPQVKSQDVDWRSAIGIAAELLKSQSGDATALIASARMTNVELFLVAKLARQLGIASERIDVLPRIGEPDGILIPADRNSNTAGARLSGLSGVTPGSRLPAIAAGVKSGAIKTLICFEDATRCGLSEEDLSKVTIITMDILPNRTTAHAAVLLPSSAWVEKRGSLINFKGRLQRLNRAVQPPGLARDDWEILRDMLAAVGGDATALTSIENVFKQMSAAHPEFAGLSLSKIGDVGVPIASLQPAAPAQEAAK